MDKDGTLLAKKAFVIGSKSDLTEIAARGGGLYINVADSEVQHRAYVDRLYGLVRDEKSLGEIAGAQMSPAKLPQRKELDEKNPDWLDLLEQCNFLLRDSRRENFLERLDSIYGELHRLSLRNPDGTLFALIYLSSTEKRMYSATHALLTSVMCGLAAREVLGWSPEVEEVLCKAALTMNLGMTELQDRLASQIEPLSVAQRAAIDSHADKSVEILKSVGVTDPKWLIAVQQHHTQQPGALAARKPGEALARLIQRADMFAARLAPRAARQPTTPAAAMQACYFDENKQVDEAGAALIKAVGIYQPGSLVRLATDEIAIVIKRGKNTTTPRVAVLVNRSGMATVEPTIRDSSIKEHRIVASVPHRDVKVQVNLERMLPLTLTPTSERPW
jgi:HD-GYP domain-containing protein (c-di-GMP phosphodiesterase class II)